jgi:zinc resistance-associated protein
LKWQGRDPQLRPSELPLEVAIMWKTFLAGTTVLAIAGASFALADQGPGRQDRGHHWRMSAADITAYADARIAALHAGLQLNAEQEKNWPAMESALRDLAKQRSERIEARKTAPAAADPIERLNRRANAIEQRGAALKKLADAAGPLYKSMDEAQQHRFVVLARLGARHFGGAHSRHGWHGWMHHGHGGPERGPMRLEDGPRPQ